MHTPPLWPGEADAVPVRAASLPAEAAAADASDKAELSSTAVAIAGNLRTDPPGERPHLLAAVWETRGRLGDGGADDVDPVGECLADGRYLGGDLAQVVIGGRE